MTLREYCLHLYGMTCKKEKRHSPHKLHRFPKIFLILSYECRPKGPSFFIYSVPFSDASKYLQIAR